MMQFLMGFLAAWFIIAALFFVADEAGRPVAHFHSAWTYYVLASPAILPALAVAYPVALVMRAYIWLAEKLKRRRRAIR